MKHTLFPHQLDDIEAGLEFSPLALWHVPGSGKSASAVFIAKANDCDFVIAIVPTTAVYVIADEVEKWAPGEWDVQVWRKKGDVPLTHTTQKIFAIVPWSLLSITVAADQLRQLRPAMLWVDEVHFGKNAESKRGKALWGGIAAPAGLVEVAERLLFTSGTPMPNGRVSELYGLCRTFGDIPRDMTLWQHKRKNGMMTQQFVGRRRIWKEHGAKRDFIAGLRKKHKDRGDWRRISKDELSAIVGLPPRRWKLVPEQPTLGFLREYRAALARTARERDIKDVEAWSVVRRMIAEAKVPSCISYISDLLESGAEKVLVFAHHTSVIDALLEGLTGDYGPIVVLDGRTNELGRRQFSESFNNGSDVRIAIGQIQAAGTALTLHANGACRDVVFAEGTPVPGDLAQAADRIHRIGQPNSCIAHLMVMRETIEDSILRAVFTKLEDIEALVGDRAVEIA